MILRFPIRLALAATAAVAIAFAAGCASAQAYPVRPIRLITPVAPGGPTDTAARALAQSMGPLLGQTVVVDNRAGAGGTIGTESAARAAPDGYTLLLASAGTFVTASLLNKNLAYNIEKDFAAVSQVSVQPLLLIVNASVPVSSLKEFIAYARGRPGKLNFSSAGNATSGHLAAVLFNRVADIEGVHIAYKGAAPGMLAVVSNEVQYQFSSTVTAKGLVETGKLKALAVAGDRRSSALPDVPTFEEAGLRFSAQTWTGIVVPAGTPPTIVNRLAGAIHQAMASKEVHDQFAKTDTRAVVSTPGDFAAMIARERRRWAEVIEKYDIRL